MTKTQVRALSLVLGVISGLGCAGGQGRDPPPVASLAASRTAQQTFRAIRQEWATGAKADKSQLKAQLRSFLTAFPEDGDAPLARAHLAFVLLDEGELDQAQALVANVLTGPPGTARDTAEVVEGAILLARHRADLAYERLLPLVGKIIDAPLRVHFNRLIVRAATESGRAYEALAFMDAWLRDSQIEDRTASEQQVARALGSVPTDVLEVTLHSMERGDNGSGYGRAIRKAILARLADVALERHDPALARKVVQSGATGSESLEDLASSGAPIVVEGHTIGLVVSTAPGWQSMRSADVLLGAVEAVRSGSQKADDRARLVTRDLREGARVDLALMTLASQGASVLIAGLDTVQATIAAKFAEFAKTPTILLTPPSEAIQSEFVFVVGEPEEYIEEQLRKALRDRGAHTIATVRGPWDTPPDLADAARSSSPPPPLDEGGARTTADGARGITTRARNAAKSAAASPDGMTAWCTREAPAAGESRFPVQGWRDAHVDGLLVLADVECGRDALGEMQQLARAGMPSALGLSAAQLALTPPRWAKLLVASAGRFPLIAGNDDSPLEASRKRNGVPPSWPTVVGHDAAALARAALRSLPLQRTDDPAGVSALHAQVKQALTSVQADLWSTGSTGFAGKHILSRVVRIREVSE